METSIFNLDHCIEILKNTPLVLEGLLREKSEIWIKENEGEHTWSPIMVLRHLILAEKNNWMPRIDIILSDKRDKHYKPFIRQSDTFEEQSIQALLADFSALRKSNLKNLTSKKISLQDFNKTAIHPAFGEVTLSQQLSTWCVHDLGHISQICRVMAFQYKDEVGPWREYLSIVQTQ